MRYQGKRNCIKCSRWLPISDYNSYYDKRYNKTYIAKQCKFCVKKYNIEYSYNRRREKGIPPKSVYSEPLILEIKRLGWTKKQIACVAKVDVRRVYDWEHGKENIGLRAADNLCIATGIDLNSLIK